MVLCIYTICTCCHWQETYKGIFPCAIWTSEDASGIRARAWVILPATQSNRGDRSICQSRFCRETCRTIWCDVQGIRYRAVFQTQATQPWDIPATCSANYKQRAGIPSLSATITFKGTLWGTTCTCNIQYASALTIPCIATKETSGDDRWSNYEPLKGEPKYVNEPISQVATYWP